MLDEIHGLAVQTLQEMADDGQLQFPEPWINDRGATVVAWDEEEDGGVLACYLDMFGLNGREIRHNRAEDRYLRRLNGA